MVIPQKIICSKVFAGDEKIFLSRLVTWVWLQERQLFARGNPFRGANIHDPNDALKAMSLLNGLGERDPFAVTEAFFRNEDVVSGLAQLSSQESLDEASKAFQLLVVNLDKDLVKAIESISEMFSVHYAEKRSLLYGIHPWLEKIVPEQVFQRHGLQNQQIALHALVMETSAEESVNGVQIQTRDTFAGSMHILGSAAVTVSFQSEFECSEDRTNEERSPSFWFNSSSITFLAAFLARKLETKRSIVSVPRIFLQRAANMIGGNIFDRSEVFRRWIWEYVHYHEMGHCICRDQIFPAIEERLGPDLFMNHFFAVASENAANAYSLRMLQDRQKLPLQWLLSGWLFPENGDVNDLVASDLFLLRAMIECRPGDWLTSLVHKFEEETVCLGQKLQNRNKGSLLKITVLEARANEPELFLDWDDFYSSQQDEARSSLVHFVYSAG